MPAGCSKHHQSATGGDHFGRRVPELTTHAIEHDVDGTPAQSQAQFVGPVRLGVVDRQSRRSVAMDKLHLVLAADRPAT